MSPGAAGLTGTCVLPVLFCTSSGPPPSLKTCTGEKGRGRGGRKEEGRGLWFSDSVSFILQMKNGGPAHRQQREPGTRTY